MPNWCENKVTIKHNDLDRLKKLHEKMLEGNFLKSVIPVPDELNNPETACYGGDDREAKDELRLKMLEKFGYSNWYDFCVDKWGTKWDVEICQSSLENSILFASFDSAWSPPIGIYQELTEQGFEIDARFFESGMEFVGSFTSEEGETVYTLDDMPEELDREFLITESRLQWDEEA